MTGAVTPRLRSRRPRSCSRKLPAMEGECACGEVRYRLGRPPLFVHCCHCLNCQRQTGAAFAINVLIERDHVEVLAREPDRVPVPRRRPSRRTTTCRSCGRVRASSVSRRSVHAEHAERRSARPRRRRALQVESVSGRGHDNPCRCLRPLRTCQITLASAIPIATRKIALATTLTCGGTATRAMPQT